VSRVAIVTGGGTGIGRAAALALHRDGCRVVIAGRRPEPLEAVREQIGDSCVVHAGDIRKPEVADALIGAALERFGRIDALVNNAAYYTAIVKRPFEEIDDEEWSKVFDVNVRGAWLCARAVAPAMRGQGSGKIVNVSSMTVPTAPPGFAHYVASKAAIVGLTRALARELGEDGISVNTLTPDYIAFDRDYDNRQLEMADALAAQRIFARTQAPEDMIGALLFLLGPGSDFVTGQNIWVNGGRAFN
jgi:3-oxoacyl-[acyl-carrier protein] reductase